MVLDWLAVGLDPARATLFQQSAVKEHAELYLLLGMLTPVPWLERNPTYKEQRAELQDRDLSTYGFLGYPVLQAADVLMYKAWGVPVGNDQAPHIELAREIARRFNATYGDTFPEPQTLLTDAPRIAGTDGRKMSKSYGNAVYLTDPAKEVEGKLARMITDPRRARPRRGGRNHGACAQGSRPVNAPCTVRLPTFEGPLDLLLHLIKKNEVQITDIPIASITDQYLAMLEELPELNLDGAGEYLVMAATLMYIKSRMLLPSPGEDPEVEEDPRAELVQQT